MFVQNYVTRLAVPRLFRPTAKREAPSADPPNSALTFEATERGTFDQNTLLSSLITCDDTATVPAFVIGIKEKLRAKRSISATQQVRFAIIIINILFFQSLDRPPSSPTVISTAISMRTSSQPRTVPNAPKWRLRIITHSFLLSFHGAPKYTNPSGTTRSIIFLIT